MTMEQRAAKLGQKPIRLYAGSSDESLELVAEMVYDDAALAAARGIASELRMTVVIKREGNFDMRVRWDKVLKEGVVVTRLEGDGIKEPT